MGDNEQGGLGFGDNKPRIVPAQLAFFDNKRIIDFTCGTGFSVIIAETYTYS